VEKCLLVPKLKKNLKFAIKIVAVQRTKMQKSIHLSVSLSLILCKFASQKAYVAQKSKGKVKVMLPNLERLVMCLI
jgi:hypothetical protein